MITKFNDFAARYNVKIIKKITLVFNKYYISTFFYSYVDKSRMISVQMTADDDLKSMMRTSGIGGTKPSGLHF